MCVKVRFRRAARAGRWGDWEREGAGRMRVVRGYVGDIVKEDAAGIGGRRRGKRLGYVDYKGGRSFELAMRILR